MFDSSFLNQPIAIHDHLMGMICTTQPSSINNDPFSTYHQLSPCNHHAMNHQQSPDNRHSISRALQLSITMQSPLLSPRNHRSITMQSPRYQSPDNHRFYQEAIPTAIRKLSPHNHRSYQEAITALSENYHRTIRKLSPHYQESITHLSPCTFFHVLR